jgi:hypothetical protein
MFLWDDGGVSKDWIPFPIPSVESIKFLNNPIQKLQLKEIKFIEF